MAGSKLFELWCWVENGGDGSANVRFTTSQLAAEKKDEAQDERWGESSVTSATLEYEDGKLYLIGQRFDPSANKFVEFRNELERIAK